MSKIFYIILGLILLIFILQISVRIKGWLQKGKKAPRLEGDLGRYFKKYEKMIVYFFSPNCSACISQEKYLNKVEEKFSNVIRVNARKDVDIAQVFGIIGTPTTIIIDKQIIKAYHVGIVSHQKILKSLSLNNSGE